MPEMTFSQLLALCGIVLALVAAYNTIMSAVKNWREEKKRKSAPMTDLNTTVREHGEKLQRNDERLTDLEESNRIILRALMAMLSHEINGNSDEKLKASFDEIQKYLINR